jgi:transposase
MRKGKRHFVTVIRDLDSHDLLEVIDTHEATSIIAQLQRWPEERWLAVPEVSIDMWAGFEKVIGEVFVNAVIVYDRFHVMKKVNEKLDAIRFSNFRARLLAAFLP